VLTPEEFWVTGIIAFFAVFSRIALSSYYHFMYGILYEKLTYKISIIQSVAALLSLLMNLVFIKYYGILGAYVAALSVYLCQCILAHIMSRRYYYIPFEWRKIFLMISTAVALFFLINMLPVDRFALTGWLNRNLLPFVTGFIKFSHLDSLKQGQLLILVTEKFPMVIEGVIKAFFSLSFVFSLFLFRIIPKEHVLEIFQTVLLTRRLRILNALRKPRSILMARPTKTT
jgi:hypothetical protein